MPLYPLGISRSRDLPRVTEPSTAGQIAVRWVLADELAGAVIDATQVSLEPLQHAAALAAIHRQICVLPMRFHAVPSDEPEIRSLLETRRPDLLQRLDDLDGACEMGLRIVLPKVPSAEGDPSQHGSPPSSYLHDRRAYYQRQDSIGEQARSTTERLVRELSSTFRDWQRLTPSPPGVVRLAFLVPRDRVESFRRCLQASLAEHAGGQWTLLGPWPPYSFV